MSSETQERPVGTPLAASSKTPSGGALEISPRERGILVGQTGTGKSTLANYLIQDKRNLVVLDAKHEFQLAREHVIMHGPDQLSKKTDDVILYRPSPEFANQESYDRVFHWIYDRRNTFLYIDEATALLGRTGFSYPEWLRALYNQGRSLGIGVLASSQRPSNLPLFMFTESFKFWKFYLLLKRDNERMAEFMGERVLSNHKNPHSFYYRSILSTSPAREFVLKLEGSR